ncbi:YceI family protein [Variovorax saccharolyticus]|uniref:YceI family protein n=1 Tax=Variovorax saccharolyticus TaxID=3053516 RepID=UPI0025777BC9|nr:YceI family protein [Variovorax sp. J31P216]MDM0023327.1 YceI family protein [Variovorax sp. J31P216]
MKWPARVVVLLASAAFGVVHATDWSMDPSGSRLEFIARFETVPAPGVFKDFDVRARFDPQSPADGRLDVLIRVAGADMASADINKAIAGAEWFDVARYPQAEFHATEIARAAQRFVARGTLTLKGVQQPVEVPFEWTPAGEGATMVGEFVVKRAPFRIGTGEWAATDVIGPDVVIKFRVRLRKAER